MDPLAWFSHPLFHLFGQQVSVLETFAFVTGALCVWAVSRQWTWNWPVGLVNNVAFFALFLSAGLYADSGLQVAFFVLGVYGWYSWIRRRRAGSTIATTIPVRRATRGEVLTVVGLVALGTVLIAVLLTTQTNSVVPWPDAFITAASLGATWGQARKIIEQWWLWIIVDIVSIPLYVSKGLILTAILYCGFLALCVYGLRQWRRELAKDAAELPVSA
ncbi:nicotinamide mononucleotide transporter [Microbacteriaceae bacterium SG_E_30_P1]|uniref:Nicotinamide mononucleotide transporter n=1 Tax=Antiquaquibacter oligotrophicus TaxID=2880260 RepID=A0ABT6KR44_9MICO|nr:nicotinamide riboside transporter PnuC [Antiquaquibacter oligotrophicus]MDH6182448.1 nicotinamide mononucleotide transporter [Antiquaquibacter oligotrophicus]UDF14581.1 nicotinamide riboside transporter PnuC [Antiquaquibacter oligotrophicus]